MGPQRWADLSKRIGRLAGQAREYEGVLSEKSSRVPGDRTRALWIARRRQDGQLGECVRELCKADWPPWLLPALICCGGRCGRNDGRGFEAVARFCAGNCLPTVAASESVLLGGGARREAAACVAPTMPASRRRREQNGARSIRRCERMRERGSQPPSSLTLAVPGTRRLPPLLPYQVESRQESPILRSLTSRRHARMRRRRVAVYERGPSQLPGSSREALRQIFLCVRSEPASTYAPGRAPGSHSDSRD